MLDTRGNVLLDPYLPWADLAFRKNPYPWYARLQQEQPLYQISEREYIVSTYADYVEFVRLPCMSMKEPDWVKPHTWQVFLDSVLYYDPPRQTQLRRHFNRWFTPKMIGEWVKHTRSVLEEALAKVPADGRVEAHHHLLAVPTHITMCRVFQVPEDDIDGVIENALRIVSAQSPACTEEDIAQSVVGFDYLFRRCREIIAQKKLQPGTGLTDALIEAQARGELTEAEVEQTLVNFFFSGAPNPSYVLACALHHFTRDPALYQLYKTTPSVRTAMVNEFLRLYPPEMSFARYNTEEVEIQGERIPAGSKLTFMTAAVNRDAKVFADPDRFDHTRSMRESQHLSFGIGAHNCAGQLISRAEIETVLTCITERYSAIELTAEPAIRYDDRIMNYLDLPLRLVP
ncbi:cytochrome P450 [Pseudorhodoferax sp. Leaf265]|uniref:cytochrome P450 n=1 Tax=Pseudorhodoferax sp. Leaf265 TaxID=1736315 RepID=UPI0006FAF497|nr:cytochrome P450 [Pseudorhodoferax sp. Leaf265]KQP18769.1 hypothetical protein ASF45_26475 [Pseudorhodoferax sp. Leaf265]